MVTSPVPQVNESGEGRGSTCVRVKHVLEADGNHIIHFCCALWVYNCTGLPIALQQVRLTNSRVSSTVRRDIYYI